MDCESLSMVVINLPHNNVPYSAQVEELQLARKKDKEASADASREQERTCVKQAGELQSLKSRLMVCLPYCRLPCAFVNCMLSIRVRSGKRLSEEYRKRSEYPLC